MKPQKSIKPKSIPRSTRKQSNGLKNSLEWQETIFEGSRDAIFISDEHSRFIMVNKAATELTGYSKNTLLKMSIPDLHEEKDLHAYREFHHQIMSGVETISEARILRRDGTKVDTEFNNRRILIDKQPYMHSVARDISERKKNEKALREMEIALTNAMTGMSKVDKKGRYLIVNRPYAEMLGFSPNELIGKSWRSTISVKHRKTAVAAYQQMIAEGRAEFEGIAIRKDGSSFYKQVLMVKDVDDAGRHIGHHCFMRDISDRKKAEEALKSSEARYRILYNENPSMCFTVNPKGTVISVNKAGAEQLGYRIEELIGKPVIDVFFEEDKKAVKKQIRECLNKPTEVATWELRKVCKDGNIVWVREIARAVEESHGKFSLFIVCENITERKLAEQELQLSKERYELAVEAGKVGVWDWNIKTNEIYLDPKLKKMLGYKDNEIKNHMDDWTKHVHPDDLKRVEEVAQEHLVGKASMYECEHRMVHRDGSIRWFIARGLAVRDNNGKAVRMTGSDTDITDRKIAEEALRQSEQRFRDFFDNAPDLYLISDASGIILDCNKRGLRQLKYKKNEIKNKALSDLVYPEDVANIQKLLASIKKTGKPPRNIEIRLLTNKNEVIWVSLEISVLKTKSGALEAYRIACRDITERKKLQEQLTRAQRLETAGRVAGQIAHDFNNLLAPLTGYPEIIRSKLPKHHPVLAYLNEMELSSNEIAEISQQLLALGRRGYYELEPIDLNDLISKVLSTYTLPSKVHLKKSLGPELFLIKGGKSQLTRVLTNLINNACEAISNTGVLSIKTENIYLEKPVNGFRTIASGEYVRLQISDTGVGIEPENLDKVFDPFFTTKEMDRMRGSGLGLSVVHGIVEDHNGAISIESEVGHGTTFSLYFPVTRELQSDVVVHDASARGGTETIVIVDDDPIQRRVTGQILKSLGYHTIALEDGEKAVEYTKKHAVDLLILDMVMDGLDGVETYRKILKRHPEQKAIMVSGYAVSKQVKEALQMGAGAFLHKPLRMKTLAAAVRQAFDKNPHTDRRKP